MIKKFKDFFENFNLSVSELKYIENGNIEKIEVDKSKKILYIYASFENLLRKKQLYICEDILKNSLGFNSVKIYPNFPSEKLIPEYFSQIVLEAKKRKPVLSSYLGKTMCKIERGKIEVVSLNNNTDYLNESGVGSLLSKIIFDEFSKEFNVVFISPSEIGIEIEEDNAQNSSVQSGALEINNNSYAPEPGDDDAPPPEESPENQYIPSQVIDMSENSEEPVPIMTEDDLVTKLVIHDVKSVKAVGALSKTAPIYPEGGVKIFGKELVKDDPVPLKDIAGREGRFVVWGDIFKIETKETRTKRVIIEIEFTDYTSSATMKLMRDSSFAKRFLNNIFKGQTILVAGKQKYDEFTKAFVLEPYSISAVKKETKEDTFTDKRVELHLHTSFSEMDGMTSPTKLVERAAKWGHKAIAVTDHGVVQALPEGGLFDFMIHQYREL